MPNHRLDFDPYHATDLVQLPAEEYDAFMQDLRQAGAALRVVCQPDHMNCECLGKSGPHLHWHLFPRYQTDPRWGRPVWEGWQRNEFNLNRVVLDDREYLEMMVRVRAALTN